MFVPRTFDDSLDRVATVAIPREQETEPSTPSANMGFISRVVLFLRIFAFAAAVPYLLRRKLPKVASTIEPGTHPSPVHDDEVRRIAAYIETAIRRGGPFVRPGCLTRGVARYYFLRRLGMDVELCFGMGRLERLNREFMGHCWLVRNGEPFLEPEDPRPLYVEMYRISPARRRPGQTD